MKKKRKNVLDKFEVVMRLAVDRVTCQTEYQTLHEALGVPRDQIGRWNVFNLPPKDKLQQILEIAGMDMEWLEGGGQNEDRV